MFKFIAEVFCTLVCPRDCMCIFWGFFLLDYCDISYFYFVPLVTG